MAAPAIEREIGRFACLQRPDLGQTCPSAAAALRVTPAKASSGVRRNRQHARFIAISNDPKW